MYTALKKPGKFHPIMLPFLFFYRETPLDFFLQNCKATTNQDLILDSSPPSLFGDGQQRFVYSKHC